MYPTIRIVLPLVALLLTGVAAAPPIQDATLTAVTQEATASAGDPFVPPVWVSPTPDDTGAIVVIVQPGDSMWVIAARAGLSLPELMTLNNLTESSIIIPGDALVIGYVTPEATSPEEATPAATLPPPTPRPTETRAEAAVCLAAFDDLNRDGAHDTGEPLRAGVAFTIYNTEAVVANYITDGVSEPKCLRGLAPGEYRVTRSIRPGEVLTTEGDWSLNLAAGAELRQSFGSFMGGAQPAQTATPVIAAVAATQTAPALPPQTPAAPLGDTNGIGGLLPRLIGVIALFVGGLLLLGAVLILLFRQSRSQPGGKPESGGPRRFRDVDDLD